MWRININSHTEPLLLDYLAELTCTWAQLSLPNATELFNKPELGLSEVELKKALAVLVEASFIQIDSAGQIALTAAGGQRWEQYFKPNWQHFVLIEAIYHASPGNTATLEISALDEALLRESYLPLLPGINVDVIEPWYAFYWKSFPKAYGLVWDTTDEKLDDLGLLAPVDWRLAIDQPNTLDLPFRSVLL